MENRIDRDIKHQLLDIKPLEGGVVFGKEEAWEKLQGRMDGRKKPKLLPWLAAAAILLAMVMITRVYLTPVEQVKKTASNVALPELTTVKDIISAPVVRQPETVYATLNNKPVHRSRTLNNGAMALPRIPIIVLTVDTVIAKTPVALIKDTVKQPAHLPIAEVIRRMRVVHINEVGTLGTYRDSGKTEVAAARNGVPFYRNAMRVVHVNELYLGDFGEEPVVMDTRVNLGKIFLFKPDRLQLLDGMQPRRHIFWP